MKTNLSKKHLDILLKSQNRCQFHFNEALELAFCQTFQFSTHSLKPHVNH